MNTSKPTYDVVLTFAPSEIAWAVEVERRFADAGLTVYKIASAQPGDDDLDHVWDAHADSDALVLLIAPGALPPLLAFEVGAAMRWEKPAYAIFKGTCPVALPAYVEQHGIFPASEVDQVVKLVRKAATSNLSEGQQVVLMKSYASVGAPLDKLLSEPAKIEQLARRFNREAHSKLSGDRLLRELLPLRKAGRWPKLRPQRV